MSLSQSWVGWLFTCFDVEDERVVGYRQNRWDWRVFREGEGDPFWIGLFLLISLNRELILCP